MNILVVDDSEVMRGIVKQAIDSNASGKNVTYFEAGDGQSALDQLEPNGVELVILDWNMPILDGLSFVQKVRESGSEVPIIMVTSITDVDEVTKAVNAGVNSYVTKPIRGDELWAELKEFFD